ncbi:type II toxin-antitoxin system RnlA family toxin [Aeromonas hydrophila]|uniref:type II toxin-antitoxin system RnlA family toxin n=2 Tax=Aeromonadaceae TaxID=84642 RepID=UPI0030D9527D
MAEKREDYRDLNLDRTCIDRVISGFIEQNSLRLRENTARQNGGVRVQRYKFGRVGIEDATIELFLNLNGTTTLHYRLGQNPELGHELAQCLFETIHPDEFNQVNMTIKGIEHDQIQPIIDEITSGEPPCFHLEIRRDDDVQANWCITSVEHSDHIVVTHYKTTRKLQIQGKPLSTYRHLIYLLSELLDMAGLENVLNRTEDGKNTEIVRTEVALDYLKMKLPKSIDLIPEGTKRLLLSSLCVKLSAPQLPDYSMLLYPELRSLEGAIKSVMADKGLDVDSNEVGSFYYCLDTGRGDFVLRREHEGKVPTVVERSLLSDAYSFFRRHRHGLFHMNSLIDSSRFVSDLNAVNRLSTKIYSLVDELHSV